MGTTLLGEERKEGVDARHDGVFPVRRTEDKAPCVTRAVLTTALEGPSTRRHRCPSYHHAFTNENHRGSKKGHTASDSRPGISVQAYLMEDTFRIHQRLDRPPPK